MTQPSGLPNEPHPTAGDEPPTPTDVEVRPSAPKYAVPIGGLVRNLDEAYRLSQALALANVVPKALQGKPSDVLAVILYGHELGLSPMKAIKGIDVVEGNPRISGKLWGAKLRENGHRYRVVERVPRTSCTVEITRGDTGEVHVETYTIEDAITARLCSRDSDGKIVARSKFGNPLPWELQTDRMLFWRTLANGATIHCPEVVFGFDVDDGAEHLADEPVEPVRADATRTDSPVPAPVASAAPPTDDEIRAAADALAAEFAAGDGSPENVTASEPEVIDGEVVADDESSAETPAETPADAAVEGEGTPAGDGLWDEVEDRVRRRDEQQ
jgi:hypothetical protein